MTEGAWLTGMRELLTLPDRDLTPAMLEERGRSYRTHLNCLTDHQWQYAVSEAVRLEKMFPAVATLLEYGDSAPPAQLLDWSGECGLCEGSGFEPFERRGVRWVRHCPRGCKPHRSEDGPKRERPAAEVPFPEAKGIIAKLEAICREKTRQGLDGFKYAGIEEHMAAEAKPAKEIA